MLSLEPKDRDYDAVVSFYRREYVVARALRRPACLRSEGAGQRSPATPEGGK
jgi:hypothetical protein